MKRRSVRSVLAVGAVAVAVGATVLSTTAADILGTNDHTDLFHTLGG